MSLHRVLLHACSLPPDPHPALHHTGGPNTIPSTSEITSGRYLQQNFVKALGVFDADVFLVQSLRMLDQQNIPLLPISL